MDVVEKKVRRHDGDAGVVVVARSVAGVGAGGVGRRPGGAAVSDALPLLPHHRPLHVPPVGARAGRARPDHHLVSRLTLCFVFDLFLKKNKKQKSTPLFLPHCFDQETMVTVDVSIPVERHGRPPNSTPVKPSKKNSVNTNETERNPLNRNRAQSNMVEN